MVSVPTSHSMQHSCSNPLAALRRDSLFNEMDKRQLHELSCIPLTDTLCRLIQAQRDLQNTLMQNYDALKIRHRKLVAEYEQLCARDNVKAVMKLTTENKLLRQRLDEEIQLRINLEHALREVTLSLNKKVEQLTRNHMLAVQPDSTFEPLAAKLEKTIDAGFDIHSGSMEIDAEVSLDRINSKTAVTTSARDGTGHFKYLDDVQSDCAEPTDLKQKKTPVAVHIDLVGEWSVVYSRDGTTSSKYIHEMRIGTTQIRHDCSWSELDTTLVTSARARIKYVTQHGGLRRIDCIADIHGNAKSPQNYCINNSQRESDPRTLGYRLGNISWVSGSPPTYNKTQRSTNDGMEDSAGGNTFGKEELRPVDFFLQVTKISHESSMAVNNTDASQPIPLVIQFHPITGVALECGLTECYVQNCLDLLSKHSGLIWYSQTAVVWTRRVLHLMAGLTMLELSDNPKSQLTQHIVTLSEQTKPDSFRFIMWLLSQNLVTFKEETDDSHQSHPQRRVLLVLESLHFLNDPQNLSDFLHFFGVALPGSEQADWCSCTTDVRLLAATDHMPAFHKIQHIGQRDENQWFVWPLVVEDSKSSRQRKCILIHQLSLFKEPLSGVVPALLRFAGLRCAPQWDEKVNRTIKRRERNDANQILFDWIEQIWFRLIEIVTLLGRDPSKLLQHHSERNDRTSPLLPASNDSTGDAYSPDSNFWHTGAVECQKSNRTNVSTMEKLSDQDFVVAALDILNPDVFITCPSLSYFRFKTVVQETDILRWLERSWNGIWEPGLQACVTPDPNNLESGTITDEWATMAKRQPRNVHIKPNRPRSEESDIAATWFVRSIIMPGCPLKNSEFQQFISRLTGGSELISTRTLVTRQQILDTLVTLHPASALKERTITVPDRTVNRMNVVNTTEARRTVDRVIHSKACERAKHIQMQPPLNRGESDAKQMTSTEPSQTKSNKTYRSVCPAKTNAASGVTSYSIITKSSDTIPQRAQSLRYSKIGQEGRIDTSHTPIRRSESAKSSHKFTFKRPMSFDT
ncbi:hypothetical protein P879_02045 [Paragonimus westermani]|uniref:Uncharacterized protein n=1 Tax=Paragonimus westermani TaxID=34504 RepID=A0A8T0DDQ9_9TREM|nr:hypothetical protein P879_02045 [Paragonimus westermani]